MLRNATLDEAKGNKFSNTAHAKFMQNNYNVNRESVHEPSISVTVPRELVERILLFLDSKSMLTCKLINREFNDIIQSSTVLQYILACKAAGVIDNPQSPLSYAERLEALRKKEGAWTKLKPIFEMSININHQADSRICRTTEGVCFLSDENLKDLNYCVFTSSSQDNPLWTRIPGHGPGLDWSGILVNFGAALYEHDLIVNIISSDIGNQTDIQQHSLDLVLLKFSTGEYHPLARHHRIHVQISSEVEPWVVSRIVGDHLALVVHSNDDKLFVFDWKTGRKLLQQESCKNAYSGLVFVSPELLVVPNCTLSHLEVWLLPPYQLDPKPPIQIFALKMPAVSSEYFLVDFDCYGEPNPSIHSMSYLPPQHFLSSSDDSIIVIKYQMSSNSGRYVSYNLIVHRRALLHTIQTCTSPSLLEQQEYLPRWMMNEVTVDQIADPEDGSVKLDAQSKLVSMMPHPRFSPQTHDFPTWTTSQASQTFPSLHISADSGSSYDPSGLPANSSISRYVFLQVPWANWGPPISRWFQINENQAQSLNHSNGQRYAISDPNPLNRRKLMVSVADFNQYNVRRLRSGEGGNNNSNGNDEEGNLKEEEKEEFEMLNHKGVFSEEVNMGLKCVVYRAPDEYDFDVVSMDGERLLGVKLDHDGRRESVKVLYIG